MDIYEEWGNHPLFGRRILHIMSPVRWSGNKFEHDKDSNYYVYNKIVDFLPMCHHTSLVPENNSIIERRNNVTLIPHPYPASVLYNRGFFDTKAMLKELDFTKMDFDFVMCHQPEILYNVLNGLQTGRYGMTIGKFVFFHWVDSPKSRPTSDYPVGYFRQLEGIHLSSKAYFHCTKTLDYLKDNWREEQFIGEIIDDKINEKISYFPLGVDSSNWDKCQEEPFELPKKKILLFNHRWNKSTGIKKLIEYTKDLDRNEYLVWLTDRDAKNPKAGEPAPDWMKCKFLSKGQYKYLIKNAHFGLSFVHDYMTWNLSVQDSISLDLPTLVYNHPIMSTVIGEDYPMFFKTKKEFLELIEKGKPTDFKWTLPDHNTVWENNIITNMINYIPKIVKEPGSSREWLYHIKNGINHKKNLLYNTHPHLFLSNSWERIRLWCLENGAYDDPTSNYTKMHIRPEKIDEVNELIKELSIENSLKDPNFTIGSRRFW